MSISMKERVAIGLSSAMLVGGLVHTFQPPSHDTTQRQSQQTQQQVDDLSSVQEKTNEDLKRDGQTHGDAENAQKLIPGEHRPPEPHLRLRMLP